MQQINNNQNYIQEDEIDLRELWNTIMKSKKFIIIFTSIVTIGAIVFAFLKTPIYEARALVEIGNYKLHNNNNNKSALDNASQLTKKLNVLYIDMPKSQKDRLGEISSISVPKKQKDFIEIKSLATSNELAIKEVQNVVGYIQNEHQKILDDVNRNRTNIIKNIDMDISKLNNTTLANLNYTIAQKKTVALKMLDTKIDHLNTIELMKIENDIDYTKKIELVNIGKKIISLEKSIELDKNVLEKNYSNLEKISSNPTLATLRLAKIQFLENKIFNNEDKLINLKAEVKYININKLQMLENKKRELLEIKLVAIKNKKEDLLSEIKRLEVKRDNIINIDLNKLISKKETIASLLLPHNYKNSEVVGEIITNDYPVKPKKKLIVVVAFVTGLILSIFLVFFLNFIRDEKDTDK